jgi:hypothetical protein
MVESLDKAGLPRTASIDKTEKFIRNDLNGHMGRDTVSKVVRIRKSDSLPKPSWSTEEHFQPPHQLTEEDLFQSEHNAFHAKRRSAPKMEREWFGSFHEEDTTDWNDSESDQYPNEW